MKTTLNSALSSIAILAVSCLVAESLIAQTSYKLRLLSNPSEGTFGIRAGNELTISPGGTVIAANSLVNFNFSFLEFQNEVSGTWTLIGADSSMATFDLVAFQESEFPSVVLTQPFDGQELESGEFISPQFQVSGSSIVGNNYIFDPAELDLTTFSFVFSFALLNGLQEADAGYFLQTTADLSNRISNINADNFSRPVSTTLGLLGTSDRAEFKVVQFSILGDINRDGQIDLTDISPFIQLLVQNQFQFEADVNQDEAVDLLDVSGFVEILLNRNR